eukprot:TRINITY_DN57_c4_g1_i1.p1 TRINITY_DN57_c4_g1~~TRINITY_DN57_c4_g1_i1.p1  ORF type:complete len:472 (+),score=115.22 TRINITY_DN57_c4_g1_i1:164-1417(+)
MWGLKAKSRVNLPGHLLNHPVEYYPNLLPEDVAVELRALVKEMAEFPTNANDLKFYKTKRAHTGEATPLTAEGSCPHSLLLPTKLANGTTICALAGRVDVARHFILTGGAEGLKEDYLDSVSRLQSFGRFMFNATEYPVVEKLFASESFQAAAKSTCPPDKQFVDPSQFNFIMQVPGQAVAIHIDAPYFWGATRFEFPQWLLATMVFSGLWEDQFVDQIQVVAYLHEWEATPERGGQFVYWDENQKGKRISPIPNSGSVVDGSKTVHSATIYGGSHAPPPRLNKDKENKLLYIGDNKWNLLSDGEVVREYDNDELRTSVVYRAKCFRDAAERDRWNNFPEKDQMTLEEIKEKFKADLVSRNRSTAEDLEALSPLDFALLLIKEYIAYPLPSSPMIPYNYCALSVVAPTLKPLLSLIC